MTDVAIDKLIFALDGDLSALKARYAEAEAGAQKTGTTIHENLGKGFKEAAEAAGTHSAKIKASFTEAAKGAEHLGNNVNISRRELVYLVRELVSGDFQRAPATIALMTSHFLELSGATIAVGAGILAIPAALVIVAEKADASLAKLRTSLALTGYASGLSVTQASVAASQIATQVPMGMFAAREFVAGMAADRVPAASMVQAGVAAGNYSKATGASTEETQKIIKQIFAEPSKSAEELNNSMGLLTNAQTRQVEELEKSGEYQKASQIVLEAFSGRAKDAAEQAGFLARAMASTSSGFSNFGGWLAHFVGVGMDDVTRLRDMQNERKRLAGQAATGDVSQAKHVAELDTKISALQAKIQIDQELAGEAGHRSDNNRLVTAAMRDVDAESGVYAKRQRELNEELERDTKAVEADHEQRRMGMNDLRDAMARARQLEAVKLAIANQKTPAELAAQEAKDAKYLAGLPSDQVAVASAKLQAQRNYEKNAANPATALDAEAIRKAEMAKAELANAQKTRAQNEEIANIQLHARNQMALVDAYKDGRDAVLALAAAEDAEEAAAKHSIRTSQEHAKAVADLKTAFSSAAKAVSEHLVSGEDVTEELRNEVAAGGDPAAIRRAKLETDALRENREERDAALALKRADNVEGEKALRIADEHLRQLIREGEAQDTLKSEAAVQGKIFDARSQYRDATGQAAAIAAGADSDDLRRLGVQQQTYNELVKLGIPPLSAMGKELAKFNVAASDAADRLQKMQQYTSDLASGVTGPFRDFLRAKGEMSPLDMAANIGENTLNTLVEHEIIDPFQKSLEGLFGGMMGTPKDLLGTSPATPMYVQDVGGMFGGGGGAAGTGIFDNLFGGGGGGIGEEFGGGDFIGTASESGGIFDSLLSFAGLFDGGGTIGPNQWGIKSGMPEIIQGGIHGVSILPLTAPVIKAATGAQARGPGANSNPGGPGNGGGPGQGSVTNFWNITTPDAGSFIQSRSQIQARFTQAAAQGQRNT